MPEEKSDQKEPKKKKKQEDPLPACTSAPSAEHARAVDDDEPCDDGRAGGEEPRPKVGASSKEKAA